MLRKFNFEMVVLFALMILALTVFAFVLLNSANVVGASDIGEFVGVCGSVCGTNG